MKAVLYTIWQCTWGILQTMMGFIVFLAHLRDKHYLYHGAIITEWGSKTNISLGMFIFITDELDFYEKRENCYFAAELSERLLVHEYGHTIQSLLLGPLYLVIIGIPSMLWGVLPYCNKKRKDEQISYCSFFTEKWANHLGERTLRKKSMRNIL